MRKAIYRASSIMLALALLLGLTPGGTRTAMALDISYTINGGNNVNTIQNELQPIITAANPGDTVTVTGGKGDADATLALAIPAGVTVKWEAAYSNGAPNANPLIKLAGSGIFEVSGGSVKCTDAGIAIQSTDVTVIVSGGTVEASEDYGKAIDTDSGDVTVSGGKVKAAGDLGTAISTGSGTVEVSGNGTVEAAATEGRAIQSIGGNVEVSGNGTVEATGDNGRAISSNSSGGAVTVRGGAVTVGDNGTAIFSIGTVAVSGGTVTATTGKAIHSSRGTVAVSGGTVEATVGGYAIHVFNHGAAAYLKGTCTGRFVVDNNMGMIVEVDTLSIPASWGGTSQRLTTIAGGNTVKWDTSGSPPKIVFTLQDGSTKEIAWGTLAQSNHSNGGWFPPNPVSQPAKPAPSAFPAQGEVLKRISVYQLGTLKKMLFRLSKGDGFTVLGISDNGKALLIAANGKEGYIALKDISVMFGAPLQATARKKAGAYVLWEENGKLTREGYFAKGQTLWIYGIWGKYLINRQTDATYYLDAGQWRLFMQNS